MFRGTAASTTAAGEGKLLKERLALDAATETVIAELVLKGPMSRWGRIPARATVAIGDMRVTVAVTSESGRLDLNAADLATIDLALRRLGFNAAERGRFAEELQGRRDAELQISSSAEARALLATLGPPSDGSCLNDLVTVYSALDEPRRGQMPRRLGEALKDEPRSEPLEPGAALRLEARTDDGSRQLTIIRITGLLQSPYAIVERNIGQDCGDL
jgi:hypothetical protein